MAREKNPEAQSDDVDDVKDDASAGAPDTGSDVDWKAEAEKWKALSRKHEQQAKANADAARRLKDAEDADKTEVQKLTELAAQHEKAAGESRSELMRLRVAMRKGLTEAQAKRLIGATEEELEADADELLASFGASNAADGGGMPTRPKERLRSGAAPDEEPEETDPRKLAASLPRL